MRRAGAVPVERTARVAGNLEGEGVRADLEVRVAERDLLAAETVIDRDAVRRGLIGEPHRHLIRPVHVDGSGAAVPAWPPRDLLLAEDQDIPGTTGRGGPE